MSARREVITGVYQPGPSDGLTSLPQHLSCRVYLAAAGADPVIVDVPMPKNPFAVLDHLFRSGRKGTPQGEKNVRARAGGGEAGAKDNAVQERAEPRVTPPASTTTTGAGQQAPRPRPPAGSTETPTPSPVTTTRSSALEAAVLRSGVRDTSLKAYRILRWSGALGEQQQRVLALWRGPGRDPAALWTRNEIERETGVKLNAVCGRVNEMMKEPFALLIERGKKTCSCTGNEVNAIGLAKEEDPK